MGDGARLRRSVEPAVVERVELCQNCQPPLGRVGLEPMEIVEQLPQLRTRPIAQRQPVELGVDRGEHGSTVANICSPYNLFSGWIRRNLRTLPAVEERPETLDDIDYELPPSSIAQTPLAERDQARLLVDRADSIEHRRVVELPDILRPGDLLVVNDTRVLPARIPLRRPTGGAAEVLLLEAGDDGWWEALVRPSKKVPAGTRLETNGLVVEVGADLGEGRRMVRPDPGDRPLLEALADVGLPPLPPYIEQQIDDPERYQTVFADRPVSAAAPTAGLHLTDAVIAALGDRGVEMATVELAVGLDTFRPVLVDRLDDHVMHSEWYSVPAATIEKIAAATRVVAVGTTSVRALETWGTTGEPEGRSRIFIRRPYEWSVVDVLMTNFHLPRSTLLCLVDAFVGPRWRDLYAEALRENYRFLSFGDAMLLERAISSEPRRLQRRR